MVVPSQRSGSTCSGRSHAHPRLHLQSIDSDTALEAVRRRLLLVASSSTAQDALVLAWVTAVGVVWSGPAQSTRTEIDRQQACEHLLHTGPWRCRRRRECHTSHKVRRQIPGPRFGVDSPEGGVWPQKTADRLRPLADSASQCQRVQENRASRQARNALMKDYAGGGGTADAGAPKGTDMRRKTILHALSITAACPLISPTRKRAGNSHGRGRAMFTSIDSPISSREGSVG